MLTALILICSVVAVPDIRDCARNNATAVMRVPAEFTNPVSCFMHGQAFLASSSIGQELDEADRIKVICVPNHTADASIRVLD